MCIGFHQELKESAEREFQVARAGLLGTNLKAVILEAVQSSLKRPPSRNIEI